MQKMRSALAFKASDEGSDYIWCDKEKRNSALLFEFVGSIIISFSFTLSAGDDYARAAAYFMCFVFFYHISKAHFNPAVSIAVYLRESWAGVYRTADDSANAKIWLLMVVVVQILGFFAGLLITLAFAKYYISSYILFPENDSTGLYSFINLLNESCVS
jgi:hypothetical protein